MKIPSSKPLNAFSDDYLAALRERDEPPNAADGDLVGPWRVREQGKKFYIFREWESFEAGHTPVAELANREDALIFVTALRAIAGPAFYRTRNPSAPGSEGCDVEREGELVAHFPYRREEWLVAAHVLAYLTRSPADLAMLLETSGSQVQEMAGEILGQEVLGESEAEIGG